MTSSTMSPPRALSGRVALVTGAANPIGMGNFMCRALVERGARVAMVAANAEWLDKGLRRVEAVGGAGCAFGIVADVSDASAVRRAVVRAAIKGGISKHEAIDQAVEHGRELVAAMALEAEPV